jgi:nitrogenase delta subunit
MSHPWLDEVYEYVQERCLWQFFSRAWDRKENIDGTLAATAALLAGETPKKETPMERLFYADASILAGDLRSRFPDFATTQPAEIRSLFTELNERVTEITITKSRNRELEQKLY